MIRKSKIKKPGDSKRSGQWPTVRRKFLEGKTCAGCGTAKHLEAHHVHVFHLHPTLELDPANLIALCETPGHCCHFHFGHLLNWKSYNADVVKDAAEYFAKVKHRP
jgi:5-methylcytosine-specific restriction endonuclease McrA